MATVDEDLGGAIQTLEVEIQEKKARLAELRRKLPRAPLPSYVFAGGETLEQLFEGRDDLLILHNMGRHCSYCTLWADGFVGAHPHILSRTAFALVSPDEPEVQREFAASRGGPFKMVSDRELSFTRDMNMLLPDDQGKESVWPGLSGFRRQEDGSIVRVAYSYLGPGDDFCPLWHMFELLESGAGDWEPQNRYA